MTDLSIVLPGFPTQSYARLIPSLEKNLICTTDLITLDASEIAKRAQLPLVDVKRLCHDVLLSLQGSLGVAEAAGGADRTKTPGLLRKTGKEVVEAWDTVSTLDDTIDSALGGGIPTGYITEVTGESGAGKTQFLVGLLLAAQLPAPRGLSRSSLYISTESALPTSRLSQMLLTNPHLVSASPKPSLDRVISIVTPDLESQDHILQYQVPVAIKRHNIGLIVLDSVAANYRAEFERPGANRNGANMAKRSTELVKLGQLLRDIARENNIAIVVANQVADRFEVFSAHYDTGNTMLPRPAQDSPLASRSTNAYRPPPSSGESVSGAAGQGTMLPPATPIFGQSEDATLTLDHQQRWITGWGDDYTPHPSLGSVPLAQKTPSLGLVWASQIACRIALIKTPVYGAGHEADQDNERGEVVLKKWRRYAKIVWAIWTRPSDPGVGGIGGAVEFEITRGGVKAVTDVDGEAEAQDMGGDMAS